ncbi:MAG: TlpA disulfide reductase family protein [Longimicrobiales bacterium]|nr:TlpA disulfide reductase family protein [Longimicrobiales bacterium]
MRTTVRVSRVAPALLVAGLMTLVGRPATGQEGIALGETPDTPTLETLDGEAVDLAEVVGTRPVLVEFWATWCAVCRALEPRVREAHERFGDRVEFLVVAVGVSQNPAGIRRHLQRHPMPGRILWDGRGRAARAFEAPGTGYIVILDETGEVVYTGTGTDQDLAGALERTLEGS